MKYFPLKILLILIVLVPAAQLAAVYSFETYLEKRCTSEIEERYIGDYRPLLVGAKRLSDVVAENMESYLKGIKWRRWGVIVDVLVTSGGNVIVYPAPAEPDAELLAPPSPSQVASENFRLMEQGLSVRVNVTVPRGSVLDIVLFLVFLMPAALVFYHYYNDGMRRAKMEEEARLNEIRRLEELEGRHYDRIMMLNEERDRLASEITHARETLSEYREKASRNEDDMLEEIIALEEKIKKSMEIQEELRLENEALREVVERMDRQRSRGRRKTTVYTNIDKRFKTLYKHVLLNKRAIESFASLTEDMKIKAEEVIKQLDSGGRVDIKRKVDLKKSSEKVFEAIFAYSGRLYYRNLSDGRIEILVIGTKNSQVKDLSFLETL